jgi:hypothetical protein
MCVVEMNVVQGPNFGGFDHVGSGTLISSQLEDGGLFSKEEYE